MGFGFMGKILRVNLSEGEVQEEALNPIWAKDFLGGTGLAARYFLAEVPAGVDPLGEANKLIFMTGLLTGTPSASASRYSVVSKSPQTGILGYANSGGNFGPLMRRSGFDGIIFEGISPAPVYLAITDGHAELHDAAHLWGKNVRDTDETLKREVNPQATIACIGPGGENMVRYAGIMNNQHRAAGRCGLGAVMGSKRLKAVACAGRKRVPLADEEGFMQAAKRQIDLLDESILKVGFDAFGTNMVSDMVNVRGGYPTRNWQQGVFDEIEAVNAQALTDQVLVDGVRVFCLSGLLRAKNRNP